MLIVFLSLGLLIGYMTPMISLKIIEYKKKAESIKTVNQPFDRLINVLIILFNGAAWYFIASTVDNIFAAVMICIQISLGIIFAYIDIKIRIIPNELILVLLALGITFQLFNYGLEGVLGSIISMIFIMIVFIALATFMGLGKVGAGDVKLAGAIGFALGYPSIITAMGAMAAVLLSFIIIGLAIKKIRMTTMLPLAPFLVAGYIFALVTFTFNLYIG
jgi:leader peptidase (prepilin peptidase)/N-methyltransferase